MKDTLTALNKMHLLRFHRLLSISLLTYCFMLITESDFIFNEALISDLNLIHANEKTILLSLYLMAGLSLLLMIKDSWWIYLLNGLIIFFLVTSNVLIGGIDTALYFYLLILFSLSHKKRNECSHFIIFTMSWIYFFSGASKLMNPEWQKGTYLLILAESNIFYKYTSHFFTSSNSLTRLVTLLVLLIELTAPIMLGFKKAHKISNIVFIFFHLMILLTIKIPHLSLMMIACHVFLLNPDIDTVEASK